VVSEGRVARRDRENMPVSAVTASGRVPGWGRRWPPGARFYDARGTWELEANGPTLAAVLHESVNEQLSGAVIA
jgi:hypothetical protein